MKRNYFILVTAALLFGCASCGNSNKSAMNQTEETTVVKAPDFDADSAYNYVQAQVDLVHEYQIPNNTWLVENILQRDLHQRVQKS